MRRSSGSSFGEVGRNSFSANQGERFRNSDESAYTLRSSARINEIRQRTREDAEIKAEAKTKDDLGKPASVKRPTPRSVAQRNTVPRKRVSNPNTAVYSRKGSHAAEHQGSDGVSGGTARNSAGRKRPSVVKNRWVSSDSGIAEKNFSDQLWTKEPKPKAKSSDASRRGRSGVSPSIGKMSSKTSQPESARAKARGDMASGGSFVSASGRVSLKVPKRSRSPIRIMLVAFVAVLAIGGIGFAIDNALNGNKIYAGVSIGEVNVAGLTREEAVDQVSSYYSQRVAENIPTFYTTQEAQQNPESSESFENIEEQISYEESLENRTQWTIPAAKLDAMFNVDAIVDRAFEVRNLQPECSFNETTLNEILDEMTNAVGNKRVNYGIEMSDEGIASVTDGHDGNEVVRDWLVGHLNETYLGANSTTSFVLETQYMPLQITEEKAQSCADSVNASISAGAQFVYEDQTWDASRSDLTPWITTSLEQQGEDSEAMH